MRKIFNYLIGAFILVLAINAPVLAGNYYVGIQGGGSFVPELKGSDSEGSVNFSHDAGFDGSVTVGYDLGNDHPNIGNGRVELEFNTASNDISEAKFVEGNVAVGGSTDRKGIMLNTIGEYVLESGPIIFALAGLGWGEITLDNVTILGEPFVDDSSSQLAYQFGLGVAWRLSNHFLVDVSYRFYGTTDPEFTKKDGTSFDYEYKSHRLLAGFRLSF